MSRATSRRDKRPQNQRREARLRFANTLRQVVLAEGGDGRVTRDAAGLDLAFALIGLRSAYQGVEMPERLRPLVDAARALALEPPAATDAIDEQELAHATAADRLHDEGDSDHQGADEAQEEA